MTFEEIYYNITISSFVLKIANTLATLSTSSYLFYDYTLGMVVRPKIGTEIRYLTHNEVEVLE